MGCPAQICFRWHPCQLNPYARLLVDEAIRRGIHAEVIDAANGFDSAKR